MTVRYELALTTGDDPEIVAARLWAAGALGVQELPEALVGWFETRLEEVPPGGTWAQEPEQDWLAVWRAGIRPVRAGRVHVVPTWLVDEHAAAIDGADEQAAANEQAAAEDDVTLVLDPGIAFGSGHHATTRLCLIELQRVLTTGDRVLDVGCGTGILAIAAALLGAGEVEAVDVDPDAVVAARRNARANQVEVAVHLGGVEDVAMPADVVLANLLTPTLYALADHLVAAVRPGGVLIASGVASERAPGVATALAAAGAPAIGRHHDDGWSVLVHRAHEENA